MWGSLLSLREQRVELEKKVPNNFFPEENLQCALKSSGLWVAVIFSMPSSLPYFHFEWCFPRLCEAAALCSLGFVCLLTSV